MVMLYHDATLKKPLTDGEIHLGDVEIGTIIEKEIYIVNNSAGRLENIDLTIVGDTPKGFRIENIPNMLDSGQMERLKIFWEPPLTLTRGLSVQINVRGREVYYP